MEVSQDTSTAPGTTWRQPPGRSRCVSQRSMRTDKLNMLLRDPRCGASRCVCGANAPPSANLPSHVHCCTRNTHRPPRAWETILAAAPTSVAHSLPRTVPLPRLPLTQGWVRSSEGMHPTPTPHRAEEPAGRLL